MYSTVQARRSGVHHIKKCAHLVGEWADFDGDPAGLGEASQQRVVLEGVGVAHARRIQKQRVYQVLVRGPPHDDGFPRVEIEADGGCRVLEQRCEV